jgi:hypothetical protein
MGRKMITLIQGPAPEHELPSIEVRSYRSPIDRTVIISEVLARESDGSSVTCTPIVKRQPMSHDDAVEKAKKFAEAARWKTIYSCNEN